MTKINLTIDGKQVTVEKGTMVLEAARQVCVEIPHYCYHPGLSVAGNCRMCLVEIEKAPKPMIGCATECAEGMVVKTNTPQVEKMRRSVMEFLLINHPLDCPTCDQAGECRLQNYYMEYDEIPSRFEEEKVHKDKIMNIGSGVMLDQERCVACTRCIRFCQEVAKEDELALGNRGDHVFITTFPGKQLSNPYAGNVVDVCPVGALTSEDFRYKKRVWYLSKTPSVCTGCSRGCNIEINHADSKIYRLIPRHNPDVNKYWMCDEGRYGYKFVNEKRILRPSVRKEAERVEASVSEALALLASLIRHYPQGTIGCVAHAGETNETLAAWVGFANQVLGHAPLFYSRREVEKPFSDKILVTADKNANQKEIDRLQLKPLAEMKGVKALLVLNDLSAADFAKVKSLNIPVLGLWASNESEMAKSADVVLPIPVFAEQEGHFTNIDGRVQKIEAAFEPHGEAQLVSESLGLLKVLLNQKQERAALLTLAQ